MKANAWKNGWLCRVMTLAAVVGVVAPRLSLAKDNQVLLGEQKFICEDGTDGTFTDLGGGFFTCCTMCTCTLCNVNVDNSCVPYDDPKCFQMPPDYVDVLDPDTDEPVHPIHGEVVLVDGALDAGSAPGHRGIPIMDSAIIIVGGLEQAGLEDSEAVDVPLDPPVGLTDALLMMEEILLQNGLDPAMLDALYDGLDTTVPPIVEYVDDSLSHEEIDSDATAGGTTGADQLVSETQNGSTAEDVVEESDDVQARPLAPGHRRIRRGGR